MSEFAGSGFWRSVGDSDAVYLTSHGDRNPDNRHLGWNTLTILICAGVQKWWRGRVIAAGICGATLVQYGVDTARLLLEGNVFFYFVCSCFRDGSYLYFMAYPGQKYLADRKPVQRPIAPLGWSVIVPFLILLSASAIIICWFVISLWRDNNTVQPENEPDFFLTFILNNTRLPLWRQHSSRRYYCGPQRKTVSAHGTGGYYDPVRFINIYLLDYPRLNL
jgi:hypothetical protein